jgi:hypothetical protein
VLLDIIPSLSMLRVRRAETEFEKSFGMRCQYGMKLLGASNLVGRVESMVFFTWVGRYGMLSRMRKIKVVGFTGKRRLYVLSDWSIFNSYIVDLNAGLGGTMRSELNGMKMDTSDKVWVKLHQLVRRDYTWYYSIVLYLYSLTLLDYVLGGFDRDILLEKHYIDNGTIVIVRKASIADSFEASILTVVLPSSLYYMLQPRS